MEEQHTGNLKVPEVRARYVDRDDAIILDIGSHGGLHTARFLNAFPEGRVYCFEPDARAAARWRASIKDPRATLFECALGAEDGEAEFHVSGGQIPGRSDITDFDMAGSLRAPKTCLTRWPWLRFKDDPTRVSVRTLDSWAREQGVGRIDFIWADVQGAEGDLIEGGRETLRNASYFYTEYSNSEWYAGQITLADIVDRLKDDFDLVVRWPADALFRNRQL